MDFSSRKNRIDQLHEKRARKIFQTSVRWSSDVRSMCVLGILQFNFIIDGEYI